MKQRKKQNLQSFPSQIWFNTTFRELFVLFLFDRSKDFTVWSFGTFTLNEPKILIFVWCVWNFKNKDLEIVTMFGILASCLELWNIYHEWPQIQTEKVFISFFFSFLSVWNFRSLALEIVIIASCYAVIDSSKDMVDH